jgi:hypothetical protein
MIVTVSAVSTATLNRLEPKPLCRRISLSFRGGGGASCEAPVMVKIQYFTKAVHA